jgi:hypothetical protein
MRQKYFLDVFTRPSSFKFASFLKHVGASKHPKNTFAAYFSCDVFLGDEDPAVLRLSQHFKLVIEQIVQRTFTQLPSTREITKALVNKKKKTYYFTADDCVDLWRITDDVETKWLGGRNINRKLTELKNKVNTVLYVLLLYFRLYAALLNLQNEKTSYPGLSAKCLVSGVLVPLALGLP